MFNGNYLICSPFWSDGPTAQVGAVTWADGTVGVSGTVSQANSLIGSSADDNVCNFGAVPLTNGNYVVRSPEWDDGVNGAVGAVTWGNGLGGTVGVVSSLNSLVGSSAGDQLGNGGRLLALTDGNYAVSSRFWDNGAVQDAGAVTWGDGSMGMVGSVSSANSLVGSSPTDQVGDSPLARALPGGRYSVISSIWDGATMNVGASSLGLPNGGTTGPLNSANSVQGVVTNTANNSTDWDPVRERLAVGRGSAVSFVSYDGLTFDGFRSIERQWIRLGMDEYPVSGSLRNQ